MKIVLLVLIAVSLIPLADGAILCQSGETDTRNCTYTGSDSRTDTLKNDPYDGGYSAPPPTTGGYNLTVHLIALALPWIVFFIIIWIIIKIIKKLWRKSH